jgi:hypothetical protein
MEDGLKNGIKMLNVQYLSLARKIGAESNGYAQTMLGMDEGVIKLLDGLSLKEMESMADVGMPLLRLKLQDLKNAANSHRQGEWDRVASLLAAGLVADCSKEGD